MNLLLALLLVGQVSGDMELARRIPLSDIRTERIRPAKDAPQQDTKRAGPVFAVVGTGKVARDNAAAAFTAIALGCGTPRELPAATDLSLVFYSTFGSGDVRIIGAETSKTLGDYDANNRHTTNYGVTVTYRVVDSPEPAATFAFIPIGKFPAGTVNVWVLQVLPLGDPTHRVCDSATFSVIGEAR
jgi:hypothetical protein